MLPHLIDRGGQDRQNRQCTRTRNRRGSSAFPDVSPFRQRQRNGRLPPHAPRPSRSRLLAAGPVARTQAKARSLPTRVTRARRWSRGEQDSTSGPGTFVRLNGDYPSKVGHNSSNRRWRATAFSRPWTTGGQLELTPADAETDAVRAAAVSALTSPSRMAIRSAPLDAPAGGITSSQTPARQPAADRVS